MTEALTLTRNGPVATITIDRPDKRNAFNQAMWRALASLCGTIADDMSVGAVLLRSSSPKAFCAGADISEFDRIRRSGETIAENANLIETAMNALAAMPQPTIAAIEGDCFGGGAGLVLCCDFRLAATSARFAITPARLGLTYPLDDVNRLVQTVGMQMVRRMLLLAELLDAQQALDCHLIDRLTDGALDELVDSFFEELLALSPLSQRSLKASLARSAKGVAAPKAEDRARFFEAFESADLEEGMTAFLEKRRPNFAR